MSDIDPTPAPDAVEQRMREIREREKAATKGPWWEMDGEFEGFPGSWEVYRESDNNSVLGTADGPTAEFIAASRDDVPWLLDQLAAARAAEERANTMAKLLEECSHLLSDHHSSEHMQFEGDCPVCSYHHTQRYPHNIFGRIGAALATGAIAPPNEKPPAHSEPGA
jgi:hypothetical protein